VEERTLMLKKIDHIEIIPTDINRTMDFYGGTVIELISVEKPDAKPQDPWIVGYRAIAIEVDDMDSTVNYLKSKGIEITWGL